MGPLMKIRSRKHREEVKEAITHYNEAIKALVEAAGELGRIARESGLETPQIVAATDRMQKLGKISLITIEDLEGGEKNGGERNGDNCDNSSCRNSRI